MIFYGLKTCDTCRKAQKQLRATGQKFEAIDVRSDGVSIEKIKTWTEQVAWKKLLNTRSATWRNLKDADKENIDAGKAIKLMAQNPTLIKRPVVEHNGKLTVGWTVEVQAALI